MLLWGRVMLLWAGGHAFMSFYGLGGSCFNGLEVVLLWAQR